ncbi:cysteine methyltransferase [Methanomicrobiaceae archaeon CYW5]|uniref:methylated-DNA--[protein]-cysteine S-methyltransferase n=1 Tax=Methanovulcanius yangii TaxID=1789227 RepID=UPI0029C9B538|nr:MGMT family protein [Methanovulcanius yangii]MBT8507068.1 cysteine methyltransferase [Methanovulcanius yangii]
MAVIEGACRFGLWWVHVTWSKGTVYSVRFAREGVDGPVPSQLRSYLNGRACRLGELSSVATAQGAPYAAVYQAVRQIPCGETRTYAEVGTRAGTSPRVVGVAMRRNPTPLIVPCHRVVAAGGIGGFTPDISLKMDLLKLEKNILSHI